MTLLTHRIWRIGALSGAALLTVACAETQLGAQAVKEVARSGAAEEPRQELAPDAFDATGLTIWDGASTLEGVWVAHPLAQRAQRVRVTNEENAIAIEGAMFRRDPTLSGPSILVSSDAARLLGLQPGVPTELRIIALREGVYAEPTTATAETAPVETGAVETAALPAPEPVEVENSQDLETPPEPLADEGTSEPTFQRADEPANADPVASETAEVVEAPAEAQPPQPVAANPPARQPTPPKSAITAADLRSEPAVSQPVTPQPAAPQPSPEPVPAPAQPEPVQLATAETSAPQPAPAPASTGPFQGNLPSGQFVQAGAFSVEPNARSLVGSLQDAGLPAQYVQRNVNGSLLNIVMIGPLADEAAADAAIVAAAKAGAPGARKVTR